MQSRSCQSEKIAYEKAFEAAKGKHATANTKLSTVSGLVRNAGAAAAGS